MVERYVALAYDKGIMRTAQDLPQPLLWPQLQVSEGEKSYTCNQFSLSSERPMIGFCGCGVWSGKTLATLPLCGAGKAAD